MGSFLCPKKSRPLINHEKIENDIEDNKDEIFISNFEKNDVSSYKINLSSNEILEKTNKIKGKDAYSILISLIENFSSNISSFAISINNLAEQINNNKNNKFSNGFPIINDYYLDEMRHEFVQKKKKKFKNEINNEIKNKYISPILESNKKKDEEILNLNNEKNQLKSEIKNLYEEILKNNNKLESKIENLKTQIEKEKKINEENNKAKENLIQENKNKLDILKKEILSEIENLRKKIIFQIENNEKTYNSKLEKFKNENNMEIGKSKEKHEEDIQTLKKEIVKNIKELQNAKKEIDIINKNLKKKTINIINESFTKLDNLLNKKYSLNKHKKQNDQKLKLFSDKNYARVGLNNIGNNCYINSVLQVLKNIPKFTYNFYELNESDKFLSSFKDLLINICKSNISSFSPKEFKLYLGIENKRFSGNNQYDSTIFYVSLLNIINKKLNNVSKDNYKKLDMTKYENKSLQEKFEIWKNNYKIKNKTFIFEFFYIFYVNEIECISCHHKNQAFQAMNFLDFPIVSDNGIVKNLEECFINFQMEKSLEDNCSKCHNNKIRQQFIFLELPPVLIINLKRVGERSAYFNEIEIPFQLDMEKLIKTVKINSIYELRGFIKHSGDERGGHNYAFCKNMFDDKWYKYNDCNCSSINCEPELDKIFFLCYIKVGSDIENIFYLKKIMESLNDYEQKKIKKF